jgi:hypothetical protein
MLCNVGVLQNAVQCRNYLILKIKFIRVRCIWTKKNDKAVAMFNYKKFQKDISKIKGTTS